MNAFKHIRAAATTVTLVANLAFGADKTLVPMPQDAEAAWQGVQAALRPPPQPSEWRTNPPSPKTVAEYERKNGLLAGEAADKAKDFYTRFPTHQKASDAAKMELQLLEVAIQLGDTNRQRQFEALRQKRLNDPAVSADEKFELRAQAIDKLLQALSTNRAPAIAEAEKAARDLQAQFPKRDETYGLLLAVAQAHLDDGRIENARNLAAFVANKGGSDAQEEAQALARKANLVGKPVELSFTDLKGRKIDLRDYSGKVVLVDFWATWCGPCIAALPEVKEVYTTYHTNGFEILGVSLDKEKETLLKFVEVEKMSWPQYFDGLGWGNEIAKKYEITGIPTLWLLDKKGNLRDLNGRQSLELKVQKLLAEK